MPGGNLNERSVARVLVSGAFWNNFSSVAGLAISAGLTPYYIHGFGLPRWGLLALATSISAFLGPLGGGVGGATVRYFALYAGTDDRTKTTQTFVTAITIVVVLGIFISAVAWILAPLVLLLFHVPGYLRSEGTFLLRTMGILIVVGLLHAIVSAVIGARQRYAYANIVSTVSYLANALGMVICVHLHAGLRGVALVLVGQQLAAFLMTCPVALQYLSRDGIGLLPWAEQRELIRYSSSVQLMGVIGLVNGEVGALLVGAVFNLRYLAFYNVGTSLAEQIRGLTYNVNGPIGTHLTLTYARDGVARSDVEFERTQRIWVVFTTCLSTVAIGASYFAVIAWLGHGFRIGAEVATVAMVGDLVNLWTGVLTQYLAALGRPDLEARFAMVAMTVNVIGTAAMIALGPVGVASGAAVADVIASFYLIRMVHRRFRTDIRNFFLDVPWIPGILALVVTGGVEYLVRSWAPSGPLGLLYSGLPAVLGVVAFAAGFTGRRLRKVQAAYRLRPRNLTALVNSAFFG
ncbi:MAG TPA: oligosaccharide flippase family protein [Acidimicrobiales bacterium]|jgi:O-antigen/teichoic acid export membrane protein|nr:oligosaccharide flippase family protein [Acidimicrobiales bacterium]